MGEVVKLWKEIIEKNLKEEKTPNNYISLYGKTSIQEIKNESVFKNIWKYGFYLKLTINLLDFAKRYS